MRGSWVKHQEKQHKKKIKSPNKGWLWGFGSVLKVTLLKEKKNKKNHFFYFKYLQKKTKKKKRRYGVLTSLHKYLLNTFWGDAPIIFFSF